MASELRFTTGTTSVEVLPLRRCEPDISLLASADRSRYERFKDAVAADRYLRRQSELRRRLGAVVDRHPAELRFGAVANEKPILLPDGEGVERRSEMSPPHFNISSSGDVMVIAIDTARPVGVDIELASEHRGLSARSLAPALHPTELRLLSEDRLEDILSCWVYKEAWIKWTGEGMRADLKSLHLWSPGLPHQLVRDGREVQFLRTTDGDGFVGLVT